MSASLTFGSSLWIPQVVNCDEGKLFDLIFEYQGTFFDNFVKNDMKYMEVMEAEWEDDSTTGRPTRMCTYTKPLKKNSVGPTEAPVEEKQVILKGERGKKHVVLSEARTPTLPYGDYFYSQCKFCITAEGGQKSRLRITAEVIWEKSTFLKGYITRSTYEGIDTQLTALQHAIQKEVGGEASAPTKAKDTAAPEVEEQKKASRGPLPIIVYEWVAQHFSLMVLAIMLLSFWFMITNLFLLHRASSLHSALEIWQTSLDPAGIIEVLVQRYRPNTTEEWVDLLKLQRDLYASQHERVVTHLSKLDDSVTGMQETLRMIANSGFDVVNTAISSGPGATLDGAALLHSDEL
ncbi:hypothetical protein SARC_06160 [Sphaeroforma arctica JP610]|uniref:VASt domain-containing protein n=1 Tax=Sphaeroforma arctica JP610 TaxID=667725 RepID=A0A0L0FZY9_9EUKA|nr:hypothetical protein SARC_06160 [Sphaeroforma arctica JP610]KNC81533.1 hypothetical protein SARC_06160 [Sphaeroforma arctica JP610]|eukprot:XP_014155435.1 hypothetical protein SARC_06160 [Sphaeroforma arctica JP610]